MFGLHVCHPLAIDQSPDRGSPAFRTNASRNTHSDLKVHKLVRKRAHLVVQAELVITRLQRCEHKVALALLFPVQNDLPVGTRHLIIDIEGASSLNLQIATY